MVSEDSAALGIRIWGGGIVPVLELEPCRTRKRSGLIEYRYAGSARSRTLFTTVVDRQARALFEFFYRSSPAEQWRYLDSLRLDEIPPAGAGEPDLLLEVAVEPGGGLKISIGKGVHDIRSSFVLPPSALKSLLQRESLSRTSTAKNRAGTALKDEDPETRACGTSGYSRKNRLVMISPALLVILAVAVILLWQRPVWLRLHTPKGWASGSVFGAGSAQLQARDCDPATESFVQTIGNSSAEVPVDKLVGSHRLDHEPMWKTIETAGLPISGSDWHWITWGDTLWRITERYYGDRNLYSELARRNGLDNPDLIIAGEQLAIPPTLNGVTRLDRRKDPR